MASPTGAPTTSATATRCPACGADATGKFCSNCGGPLAGATCAACNAALTAGAGFCHRCGSPTGAAVTAHAARDDRGFSAALPWAVAGIALVALVALLAGQHFGRSSATATAGAAAPFASGNGQPPDISNMSPAEAAGRLYDRVMSAHERGQADTVQLFAPMAITAYQMIGTLDLDQHYDLGRIAAVAGDETLARAQADTILAREPNHLLGLILAGNAARMRKDLSSERTYYDRLVAAAPAERARGLPEYTAHANDILIALDAKRP